MTGLLISLTVVLLAIAARVIFRRPLWSIEKMALASVAYVATFWGYLDLRGDEPIAESMAGILIGTPILWIVKLTFGQRRD
jgi:energy-converting hydrogenase Eha subunit C